MNPTDEDMKMQNYVSFEIPTSDAPAAEPVPVSPPKVAEFLSAQRWDHYKLRKVSEDARSVFVNVDQLDKLASEYEVDSHVRAMLEAESLGAGDIGGLLRGSGNDAALKTPAATRRALFISAIENLASQEVVRQLSIPEVPLVDPNSGMTSGGY
jgi:hypothetical protein